MTWQPSMNWHCAKQRATALTKIRRFFEVRDVVEVETPILAHSTVTDVHLDPFITHFSYSADSHVSQDTLLYAQTSPEFAMKRLLASGYGCCYQICKAFRHEQHGRFHNPEFTLLEWYRLDFDHFQLMNEVADLLMELLNVPTVEKITYQALFIREMGIDPLTVDRNELLKLIDKNNKLSDWLIEEDCIDTLLQFIMAELIEPKIGRDKPCFVYHFPANQASLAKLSASQPNVAERFECYFKGIELANGFNELTNADQQRQRFIEDNKQRKIIGKEQRELDEKFLLALTDGLPTCSGVALGIDRLLMLVMNKEHIDEVITFNVEST